ncbi:MAG: CGNR zinc finger domain-containing protein [Gammaproteobacteria bacterium]
MRGDAIDTAWLDRIEIVGGHPAVDFVNTVHSRLELEPRDYLETPAHLIGWFRRMGLLGDTDARRLAGLTPARGGKLLNKARALRETLYVVFDGHIRGHSHIPALEAFNRELEDLAAWRELVRAENGFAWHYRVDPRKPRSLFVPLVFSAARLLRSPELVRLKACPPPDGCGWLFLDRSRNGSRTWCNMKTCGNLAKQRRHRARQARVR